MFGCEVCLACALYFFSVSRSCLRNLIVHVMSTAVSTVKNMQTADKSATTGKLALSGQMSTSLDSLTTEIEVELFGVVLVLKEVVDSVGLVVGSQGTVNGVILTGVNMEENDIIIY